MVEVKRQQGFVRPHDDDEEEDENTVREWEDGLPSLADLISLSQCLISPQLASAFSISSPSAAPARSSADVALASHAAFSSLCGATSSSVPDPSPTSPPDSKSNLQRCLSAGDGHGVLTDSVRSEGLKRCEEDLPRSRCADSASPVDPLLERNTDDSVRPDDDDSLVVRQNHQEDADNAEVDHHVPAHALEYQDRLQSSGEQGDGRAHISESNVEHEGEGCEEPNMWRPCSFEGSGIARHVSDVDVEADEAEFTPSAAENPAGEPAARTLKRPRLVWTPELHRRFVDAVTHLGLRTAVPKTIMQLMNVEGLTRENVASHLQKYRLSLKRMQQGISGEGSAASDHIFASIPLPSNLAASGRFPPGVTAHLQDVSQVPFLLSTGSPVSIHRPGILPCPLSPMDPYSYSAAYARPAHRITQQCEVPGAQSWRQHQSDPSQPVLKK